MNDYKQLHRNTYRSFSVNSDDLTAQNQCTAGLYNSRVSSRQMTKFVTAVPTIPGPSVWHWIGVTLPVPRILNWLLRLSESVFTSGVEDKF
jgi:hypothetical protein